MSSSDDIRQPEYEENLFDNLPDGALFQIPGDDHLWEKQGKSAVRNFAPNEVTVQRRRNVINEREMRGRMQIGQTKDERMLPSSVKMHMNPETSVDVRYIPGSEEIRDRFERLLQEPAHHLRAPDALLLAFEREERLRAEKARMNDQSPILKNPSELETLRTLDYEQVPMGSFFVITKTPQAQSMVYLKRQGNACNSICRYQDWENGLGSVDIHLKDVKFTDIQQHIGGNKIAPVVVLSALTPQELERLISEHHKIMGKEKREVSQVQTIYDDQMRRETQTFWNQAV